VSSFDDHLNEMSAVPGIPADGPTAGNAPGSGEFGDPSPVVTQFLSDLRVLGEDPAPAPSAELAALFAGASSLAVARARRSTLARHRVGLAIAAIAVSTAGLTGVAAAHDSLPQPAQLVVSRVVNDLTPFHVDPSRANGPATEQRSHPPATRPTESEPNQSEPNQSEPVQPGQGSDTAPEPGDSPTSGAPNGGGEDPSAATSATGAGEDGAVGARGTPSATQVAPGAGEDNSGSSGD
jgi:hypothetical protein